MSPHDNDPRPVPPARPSREDCCKGSCDPCIFDVYDDALDRYWSDLQAWEERQARRKKVCRDRVARNPYHWLEKITENEMNITLSAGPLVALIAGILILIVPRLLNYIVALYLVIIGLLGLLGASHVV